MNPEKKTPNEAPQVDFHKCCGRCPEAREAAATGDAMKPHKPCAPRGSEGARDAKPKPR